jgi:hypothetical protein
MQKNTIVLLLLLFISTTYAQVGVGTVTPEGALDVNSATDGILIPRVALSATNIATVVTPTISELVYNTTLSAPGVNQVTPGFYYWNGSLWVRLATATTSPTNWTLTGNAGTSAATNYVGTTDANPLILRTNATEKMRIAANGNIGISEPAPNSKFDIVQTETTGNSLELTHGITTNGSSAAWVKNSGTGYGFHAQNLLPASNIAVSRFFQLGSGANAHGVLVSMNNTTIASTAGILIDQLGLGWGEYILMPAVNNSSALVLDHAGGGDGLEIYQRGTGDGIFNNVAAGIGQLNVIESNNIGVASLLDTAGGTGELIDLDVQDGTGVYVNAVNNAVSPTAGGDVFAFNTNVRTATPTSGAGTVYGAVMAGNQYGVGHGVLVNHSGTQGRNAEFSINNPANPDPAIFALNNGQGSAILAQNQNNVITGTVRVGDFAYTGTDVTDHIGVRGYSAPVAGWGIGVLGQGNWYGVYSLGNMTATGVKAFTIDHPEDPKNKMLKHFSIESNEVLNMYRGVVQLDGNGEATVELPDYFHLINKDFSYQLTAIGTSQNPYVKEEINKNSFVVGGAPNTKVSWTVHATRNDAYMQQHPESGLDVVAKEGERKGKYFMPELYNQPETAGMFYTDSSKNIPTTNINIPEKTIENIEKLKKKGKTKPARPATVSEAEED